MARLAGELWRYNVAHVTVVDVTDDYQTLLQPMPSDFYPVLREMWLPKYGLTSRLLQRELLSGYSYDWHEPPNRQFAEEHWYVGVVNDRLL